MTTPDASGTTAITLDICNSRGLHARASAKFVKTASAFEADIRVHRDGMTADARSIMGLLALGAAKGCAVTIEAEGPDAEAALNALKALVDGRFDEDS